MKRTAIMLCGFGAPGNLDEIEPFLAKVIKKEPTPEHLSRAIERYKLIGGGSPLLGITRKQAESLQVRLESAGYHIPVHVGMAYSAPYISDVAETAREFGIERIIGISLSPQRSTITSGTYLKELTVATKETGIELKFLEGWQGHPKFIAACAGNIEDELAKPPAEPHVIFSAHSLPMKYIESGDPYLKDVQETVEALVNNLPAPVHHTLAFQSKTGPGQWLEPNVSQVFKHLRSEEEENVLLVPISFVSDHVETLYDIDIIMKREAQDAGLNFYRAACLNDSPKFIDFLEALVKDNL